MGVKLNEVIVKLSRRICQNGAVVKSFHGGMKREPSNVSYLLYGEKGLMETGRLENSPPMNMYVEGEKRGHGEWERYAPKFFIDVDQQNGEMGHGGSDFYPTHFFIDKILGLPNGDLAIDIYQALDMGICGILAWKSVLNGNIPMKVPNFRNPEEREQYRNDNSCTNPEIAGDELVPFTSYPHAEITDETFAKVKEMWETGKDMNGD